MQWLGSKINWKFLPIFLVLRFGPAFGLVWCMCWTNGWSAVEHCMPNSGASCFANQKDRTEVSLSKTSLWVVSNVCLNKCNFLADVNIKNQWAKQLLQWSGLVPAGIFVSHAHKVPHWQFGQPCLLLITALPWACSESLSKGGRAEIESSLAHSNRW